eukprot:TRINITY_DN29630_c0_g1_i1.p2 TRINITY_DN29630_c0_g1~~TRINITY_DN29630_c0_g1_i1.p2  ORF type:complete len:240 (-),score=106.28 TRINITY_DN29630_c0_g1_i1:109-828(-)
MEYVSPEGLRLDGRRANECRKIACRLGAVEHADGSCYLEQGNTKVLATVSGPQEVEQRSQMSHECAIVRCEFRTANFATSQRKDFGSGGDRRHKEAALLIQQTLADLVLVQLFPRSQFTVCITVLQADGGERAVALNAATLALIDAGVPLKSFLTACSAGFVDDTAIVDMNYVERTSGGAEVVVAVHPDSGHVAYLQMDSKLSIPHFQGVMSLAVRGCKQVNKVLRRFVKKQIMATRSK